MTRLPDYAYRAAVIAALQQPRTFAEIKRLAGVPSDNLLKKVLKDIPLLTLLNPTRYQLDDGARAEFGD